MIVMPYDKPVSSIMQYPGYKGILGVTHIYEWLIVHIITMGAGNLHPLL